MKIIANQSYLRVINQRQVLKEITKKQPISRAELSRVLKLSKPAVADNVNLLEQGVLEESQSDLGRNRPGRRPYLLKINKTYKYIVTVDFYYDKTVFDLFNLNIERINTMEIAQSPKQGFVEWQSMAVNAIQALIFSYNIPQDKLAAIGVSSPGVVSKYVDPILYSDVYGDFNPNLLLKRLVSEFSCPVYIQNSTNASVIGEWSKGAGQSYKNVLYISCEMDLGAGIINNNL